VGFFNRLFTSFNDPRRVDQTSVNQLMTSCDINHDGQVNKLELFTLFKKVLMGDTSAYNNLPKQQQNFGGNMYGQNQNNPNQYQGGNQFQNPYQGGNQNQGGNSYQGVNPYQGGNQYPGNNQFSNNQPINQQQPSLGNKPPQQLNNQLGYDQNIQGPRKY
jgi:hypothetical protein